MKPGDMVAAAERSAWRTYWKGTGILIRLDAGRTRPGWSMSWEVLCDDGKIRIIESKEITEVLSESR